jgi:hypothetical protein
MRSGGFAGTLLVLEAASRIHDHEMVGIDRQVVSLRVVMAHHTSRDPGNDLVHDMLVELGVCSRRQEGFHDRRQGAEAVVLVPRGKVTRKICSGGKLTAVDGILCRARRLADHGGIDFLAGRTAAWTCRTTRLVGAGAIPLPDE